MATMPPDDFDARFAAGQGLRLVGGRALAPPGPPRVLPVEMLAALAVEQDQPHLVDDLLLPESMVVVYGASNSGKTFWMVDLACSIAAGLPWRGKPVQQGAVLYLALEGGRSMVNRMVAWRRAQWEDDECGAVPLGLVRSTLDLRTPEGDTASVIEAGKRLADQAQAPLRLVVVDTLARASAGANESASEDMSALVGNGDRIRAGLGCALAWVHHSGKNEAAGARGHSSLRAATDTEIEVESAGGFRQATVRKQRDLAGEDQMAFSLRPVQLGMDRRGRAIRSCVVAHEGLTVAEQREARKLAGLARPVEQAYRLIVALVNREGEAVPASEGAPPGAHGVPAATARGVFMRRVVGDRTDAAQRAAWKRAVDDLVEARLIGGRITGWVWPAP
ncbi:helicase RepA family protein [Leptolyngbya sp. 15MV]|nr:helicase RepA family protein [Leptolyngbya sp. 15MV]